ncbi:MAG: uncharacterized protein HW386_767 [Gammaproteobacteria bacterium]|nr:uncharacterized protein [Gammaproteobacteria bacterium]
MAAIEGNKLTIEVTYAQTGQVHVINLAVASGTSIRQAIALSGILNLCPEIDLSRNKVGIFGEIHEPDTAVYDNCRVEIYRPLLADPKAARRQRARANLNLKDRSR